MCYIGSKFVNEMNMGNMTIKQCDLMEKNLFLEPKITDGIEDIKYLPFLREKDGVVSNGPWAGVNNYGVSFVAADNYIEKEFLPMAKNGEPDIFQKYTQILSSFKDAKSAAEDMLEFYKTQFPYPDILLIADEKEMYFIEAHGEPSVCIKRELGHFSSTNHMRMLPGAVKYEHNHSTYLRLRRAELIMQDAKGAEEAYNNVLKDMYFGKSVFSLCRYNDITPAQEEPYFTQASAVFYVDKDKKVNCAYQLNGTPRNNPFKYVHDVFGAYKSADSLIS